MAKVGKEKNTSNKAKHSKLIAQKMKKKKKAGALRKERLKEIIQNAREKK